MREYAKVVEVNDELATVEIQRHGSCDKCGKCGDDNDIEVEATNPIGAKEGDVVAIELRDSNVFGAALVVYFVPLLSLFLGYFIGQWFSGNYGFGSSDLVGALVGISSMVISFLFVRKYGEINNSKGKYQPEITRTVDPISEDLG
ncbi:SoxR reducing system RseC family protein [Acetohalobium arabaticum]|uniref:Positive regulator of sigma E, RseC/MucC n=1 Tax=Acetohalobium arabaticum (strain ATCC 49924 / DSM 5501 / Z-7288) TaxID=574087 RepID=D9QU53_ACEAZ|nr:SoxR reducing system RseC family protein [Acetohalobium arabaticum]ADL11846.1 positive regulator of sigma E, RseC/MucC [Acetohalobium arabaticum DSM 5501]